MKPNQPAAVPDVYRSLVTSRGRTEPVIPPYQGRGIALDTGNARNTDGPATFSPTYRHDPYQESDYSWIDVPRPDIYRWENNPTFEERQHRGEIVISDNYSLKMHIVEVAPAYCQFNQTYPSDVVVRSGSTPPEFFSQAGSYDARVTLRATPGALIANSTHPFGDGDVFSRDVQTICKQYLNNYEPCRTIVKRLAHDTLQRCYAKSSEIDNNVWVTMGERAETVAMVEKTLNQLVGVAKQLRKFRRLSDVKTTVLSYHKSTKGGIPASLADQWMQYRYGIRPLVGDLRGYIRTLGGLLRQRPRLRFYSKLSDVVAPLEFQMSSFHSASNHFFNRRGLIRANIDVESGLFIAPRSILQEISKYLTMFDALYAAWDLTMYSFVVDWFVNVSQAVQALTASLTLDTLGSWTTVTATAVLHIDCPSATAARHAMPVYSTDWKIPAGFYLVSHDTNDPGFTPGTYSCQETGSTEVWLQEKWRIANPSLDTWPVARLRLNLAKITDLGIILERVVRRAQRKAERRYA